jgi:hypothetical protein
MCRDILYNSSNRADDSARREWIVKYNYCPVCGEKLPKYHLGKLCKNCRKKEIKEQAIRTAVICTVVAGAGTAAYFYVKHHKKEVAQATAKLASKALELQAKKVYAEQKLLLEAARHVSKAKAF